MELYDCLKIGKTLFVGDYTLSYNLHGNIILEVFSDHCLVYDVNSQIYMTYGLDDLVAIEKNGFDVLTCIDKQTLSKTVNLSWRDYDEYSPSSFFSSALNILNDVLKTNLTIDAHRVILSSGVKRIIKREKGTGIRYIELGNGEIWKVHRYKLKKSRTVNSIKKNLEMAKQHRLPYYVKKKHTTHYTLIEKIN